MKHAQKAAIWEAITGRPLVIDSVADRFADALLAAHNAGAQEPVGMLLFCPKCGAQHIDAPEVEFGDADDSDSTVAWDNPPHRSHLCHSCGTIWRPADVPTNGVAAIKTQGKNDYVRRPPAATALYAQPQPMQDVARDAKRFEFLIANIKRYQLRESKGFWYYIPIASQDWQSGYRTAREAIDAEIERIEREGSNR